MTNDHPGRSPPAPTGLRPSRIPFVRKESGATGEMGVGGIGDTSGIGGLSGGLGDSGGMGGGDGGGE